MSVAFFTIVAKNYVAFAKTLCQSIAEHHPDAKIYVGLSDSPQNPPDLGALSIELITIDKLGLPDPECFAFRYDVMEFSTAIKPYLFRYIFQNTNAERIIYLDPDILVLSPLTQVLDLLKDGTTAVLTPHLTERVDDGHYPDEAVMLRVGVYNLGFIGISRGDVGHKLVDWWCARLEKGALVDLENGLFTDQKWVDLIPCLFSNVAILRAPGYNVAYWNLAHRKISRDGGIWRANDEPISFFHFSGIDPGNPEVFSKHQDRYSINNIGELKHLFKKYIEKVKSNGHEATVKTPYGFGKLVDGTHIHPAIRTYFRKFIDNSKKTISHPFNELTSEYFNEIDGALSSNAVVTRFMYGLYLNNKQLQCTFNIDSHEGRLDYAKWFVINAGNLFKIDKVFTDAASKLLGRPQEQGRFLEISLLFKHIISRIAYRAYDANPKLVLRVSKIIPNWILRIIQEGALQTESPTRHIWLATSRLADLLSLPFLSILSLFQTRLSVSSSMPGVTLVGYVRGDFGVAQNLRATAGSLSKSKYPFDIFEISTNGVHSENDSSYSKKITRRIDRKAILFCVNADQINLVTSQIKKKDIDGHYRIGVWFWELANFPQAWHSAFDAVDEVWAPSHFIQESLSTIAVKPVIHMPVAVDFKINGSYDRNYFGLSSQRFLFLFSYDFHSFNARKNPEATLLAFRKAFLPTNDQVGLVIKTINGEKYTKAYEALLEIASSDSRIKIINCALSRDEMYGLINVCDSYVSLHRAEGFGLGLAEAMRLGKPVIGTAYSGNLDFMNKQNSCLVSYKLVAVPEDAYPHWENQLWAEPDIDSAITYFRQVFEDIDFRESIGKLAREHIVQAHSFAHVGQKMAQRLKEIEDGLLKTSQTNP